MFRILATSAAGFTTAAVLELLAGFPAAVVVPTLIGSLGALVSVAVLIALNRWAEKIAAKRKNARNKARWDHENGRGVNI